MTKTIITILTILTLAACQPKKIETPKNAMNKFEQFKAKEKFVAIPYPNFYSGIGNQKLKPVLTEKINNVADSFQTISKTQNPTDEDYQKAIEKGLANFADIYIDLDTEDRERVCSYFEEIMDIVGLESSEGKLNDFMYGFDPNNI
ncbi:MULTISPECIES: DUF4844 domain-containing protein [Flavobacterium]|uniref:DUF4844 domain-containing protein n=1 Tax=Flavobacterium hankyongi TaxID=1176532 RepID=A0ABP8ZIE6_9FLAO|nr:DUF4844 domain-containing protein [Flavobacterium sp. N1846]